MPTNEGIQYILYAPGLGFWSEESYDRWGPVENATRFGRLSDLLDAISGGAGHPMIGLTPHRVRVFTPRPADVIEDLGEVS